jgi:hypothetical protein
MKKLYSILHVLITKQSLRKNVGLNSVPKIRKEQVPSADETSKTH